jgi:hypothetical protein
MTARLAAFLAALALAALWLTRRREPVPTEFDWDWEPGHVEAGPCGTCGAPVGKPHQRGCFWVEDPLNFPSYPADPADAIQSDAGLTARLEGRG